MPSSLEIRMRIGRVGVGRGPWTSLSYITRRAETRTTTATSSARSSPGTGTGDVPVGRRGGLGGRPRGAGRPRRGGRRRRHGRGRDAAGRGSAGAAGRAPDGNREQRPPSSALRLDDEYWDSPGGRFVARSARAVVLIRP